MREKLQASALLGGVIAAILASLCCVAPIALALMGLAGVGFIAVFEPYRPHLIALTLSFLAVGFYLTYRRKPDCDSNAHCDIPSSNRRSKILLWIVSVVALMLILFPYLFA